MYPNATLRKHKQESRMPVASGTTKNENVQATDLMPPIKRGKGWVGLARLQRANPTQPFTSGHDGRAGSECYFRGN